FGWLLLSWLVLGGEECQGRFWDEGVGTRRGVYPKRCQTPFSFSVGGNAWPLREENGVRHLAGVGEEVADTPAGVGDEVADTVLSRRPGGPRTGGRARAAPRSAARRPARPRSRSRSTTRGRCPSAAP